MSHLYWRSDTQMKRLKPFVGKQSPGLFSDPPHSSRVMASPASMIAASSAA